MDENEAAHLCNKNELSIFSDEKWIRYKEYERFWRVVGVPQILLKIHSSQEIISRRWRYSLYIRQKQCRERDDNREFDPSACYLHRSSQIIIQKSGWIGNLVLTYPSYFPGFSLMVFHLFIPLDNLLLTGKNLNQWESRQKLHTRHIKFLVLQWCNKPSYLSIKKM